MEEADLLECLLEMAAEADFRVEIAGRDARSADALPIMSGICRLRGQWWVVLSRSEPASAQIQILAQALRDHAGPLLASRHWPPAIREVIEREPSE